MSGPFLTNFSKNLMFRSFTVIGFVKFFAILIGTPNSVADKLGSGVITDRAL